MSKVIKKIRKQVMNKIDEDLKSYENSNQIYLLKNIPIVVRIEGKGFRTFTRGLEKPFDARLNKVMRDTLISVCRTIKGVVMGYTISDEIDLLIYDNANYWCNLNLQEFLSSIASITTGYFNRYFSEQIKYTANKKVGFFNAIAFNIPQDSVVDYFIKRQKVGMRTNLELFCESNGISKNINTLSDEDLKKKINGLRAYDYDASIDQANRIGELAIVNSSGDYIIEKETPMLEENPSFINALIDIPLFDIDFEEV